MEVPKVELRFEDHVKPWFELGFIEIQNLQDSQAPSILIPCFSSPPYGKVEPRMS